MSFWIVWVFSCIFDDMAKPVRQRPGGGTLQAEPDGGMNCCKVGMNQKGKPSSVVGVSEAQRNKVARKRWVGSYSAGPCRPGLAFVFCH